MGILIHLVRKYKRQQRTVLHNLPMQEFPKNHAAKLGILFFLFFYFFSDSANNHKLCHLSKSESCIQCVTIAVHVQHTTFQFNRAVESDL